jgi:hypothetical protein
MQVLAGRKRPPRSTPSEGTGTEFSWKAAFAFASETTRRELRRSLQTCLRFVNKA